MRENKFRVWDKDECKYVDKVDELYIDIVELGNNVFHLEQLCPGRYVIEQSTGFNDRNGKEIYDGDIVKEKVDVGDDDTDGEYIYQVVWDEKTLCWSLSPNYLTIHIDLWETNLSREVIGNIHKNSELISSK